MAYTILHNGAYWFQIRVPKRLAAKFSQIIKLNLQTADRGEAQRLAYRLAGDWLDRFAAERLGVSDAKDEPPTVLVEAHAPRDTRLPEPGSHPQGAVAAVPPAKQPSRGTVRSQTNSCLVSWLVNRLRGRTGADHGHAGRLPAN